MLMIRGGDRSLLVYDKIDSAGDLLLFFKLQELEFCLSI